MSLRNDLRRGVKSRFTALFSGPWNRRGFFWFVFASQVVGDVVDQVRQIVSRNRKTDLEVVEPLFGVSKLSCQIQEQMVEVFKVIRQ